MNTVNDRGEGGAREAKDKQMVAWTKYLSRRSPKDRRADNRLIAEEIAARSQSSLARLGDDGSSDEDIDMHGRPVNAVGTTSKKRCAFLPSIAAPGRETKKEMSSSVLSRAATAHTVTGKKLSAWEASGRSLAAQDRQADEKRATGRFSAHKMSKGECSERRAEEGCDGSCGTEADGESRSTTAAAVVLREKRGPRTPEECNSPTFGGGVSSGGRLAERKVSTLGNTVATFLPKRAAAVAALTTAGNSTSTEPTSAAARLASASSPNSAKHPSTQGGTVATVSAVGGRKGFQLRSLCAHASSSMGSPRSNRPGRFQRRAEDETRWNLNKALPDQAKARAALLESEALKTRGQVGYSRMAGDEEGGGGQARAHALASASGGENAANRKDREGRRGGAGAWDAVPKTPAMDWAQVQEVLRREESHVIYFEMLDASDTRLLPATTLVIWVVSSEGMVLAYERVEIASVLDGPAQQQLERLAEEMEDALRIYGRSILRKLYNLCIFPVQDLLRGRHNIIIVPAGTMCLIPWAALMDRRGRYLLEAHLLRVVPCLSVLARIHATLDAAATTSLAKPAAAQASPPHAVVVGDPFPISHTFGTGDPDDAELLHAEQEVSEVQRVLQERGVEVTKLVREAATRCCTLAACQGADWLHLTAHVEQSQLLLAQSHDTQEDTGPRGERREDPKCGGESGEQGAVGEGLEACRCVHRGDCNQGDCAFCNRIGRCKGCRPGTEEESGKKPGKGEEEEQGTGAAEEREHKRGKNSLREAREVREAREAQGEREKERGKKQGKRVDWEDNGVVLPGEVARKLRVRHGATVVLSACNHTKSSQDMFKLCHSFIAAGAGAVLISMWSLVDESTTALMARVYRNLRVGKSLPEALRAAMLQLAGRALLPAGEELDAWDKAETPFCMLPFSRPLHWAGLIVVGQVTGLPGVPATGLHDDWERCALLPTPTMRRQGDYL